ncbi:MAG: BatA domain-containing protein [Gemmataceae bacterium]
MLSLFANPANMVLGAALISSPIIIHLINRMRYRRVRWAAMEFLLKSQKRNKRRLIIEQLLLLLLRIILVLLAALLLARLVGAEIAGTPLTPTTHFVLLDDRLSMSDEWKKGDGKTSAFEVGKELILERVVKAGQMERVAPRLVVRRLSDPNNELFDQKLNDSAISQLRETLTGLTECSQQHLDLAQGVESAQRVFDASPTDKHKLFIVSDFRERHWFQPQNAALERALKQLSERGIEMIYLDAVADPKRSNDPTVAPNQHNNLAITELYPETRVAAANTDVRFRVVVTNFGIAEAKKFRISVKTNGVEEHQASQTIQRLEPGKSIEKSFTLRFRPPNDAQGKEVEQFFAQVTATVDTQSVEGFDEGIPGDNTRYAVLEIRKQIPILIIDGDARGRDSGGDTFHLTTVLNATSGYDVVAAQKVGGGYRIVNKGDEAGKKTLKLADLDLKQYACVYLLNVPELEDEKDVALLEAYVREGGGLAFFMGDRITNGDYYNKNLFKDGKGVFPAPLADQPTRELSDEEIRQKAKLNRDDPQFQFFIRSDEHPLFRFEMDPLQNEIFRALINLNSKDLMLTRYHPVARSKFEKNEQVSEALTLPNSGSVAEYEAAVQELLRAVPVENEKYKDFQKELRTRVGNIRSEQGGNSLPKLAAAVAEFLEVPGLHKFWESSDEEIVKLKKQTEELRDRLTYGDPLLITKNFGRGRCVAVLTSAGRNWHNWPTLQTYPVIMLGIQRYLTSLGGDADYLVGQTKAFEEDSGRYEPNLRYARLSDAPEGDKDAKLEEGKLVGREQEGGRLVFDFDQAKKPGVYVFDFRRRGAEGAVEKRALAFNVDTIAESDLRRTAMKPVEEVAPTGKFMPSEFAPDTTRDLSESAWFYLLFLLILVIEQALAVHLSFHLRGSEATAPPQAVQPQPT